MAILAGGAAGAQLVNAAVAPFVTRLFEPAQIGQLGIFLAFLQVAAIALSLRYEQAIVIPKADPVAARLVVLSVAFIPVVSLVAAGVLAALIAYGGAGYGSLDAVAVPLAYLALVVAGIITVLRFWAIRQDDYRAASGVIVVQSLVRAVLQVVAGLINAGTTGLLVSDVVARSAGVVRLSRATLTSFRAAMWEPAATLRATARQYWRFPVVGVPSALVNAAAIALPVPLVAAAYGLEMAGFMSLVLRVLGVPLSVIGASVGDALLARMSEYARSDPAAALPFFRRTGASLLLAAIPVAVVLALLGPWAFEIVFGEVWRDAGEIASLMAPWLVVTLLVGPLSRIAVIYQGQGQKLLYDALTLIAVIAGIAGGAAAGYDAFEAIRLAVWLQVAAGVVYLGLLYRLVGRGRFERDPIAV